MDRVLATVLFSDIVDSTGLANRLGDGRWRALLDEHDRAVRRELERYRGQEVNTTGDGFVATFDGPGGAIRCGRAIIEASDVRPHEVLVTRTVRDLVSGSRLEFTPRGEHTLRGMAGAWELLAAS